MVLTEVRQRFGYLHKLEDVEAYYKALQERPLSMKQKVIIEDIYQRRKFRLEHPELPKRDKR